MYSLRFKALELATARVSKNLKPISTKVSDYFGQNVFSNQAMKEYLPGDVYKKLTESITSGTKLDITIADAVASGMRSWAISKGATHYTHWFQPLTGSTAEKHDAFIEVDNDAVIERFRGGALVQQEPDASSFPSGGIRNTFEARGYTAWDPTSPAFIMEAQGGATLCIPTIFVSYTGEALDHKTPLLKSLAALDKAAVTVCQFFDKEVTRVTATLGAEQEYFLVDEALYNARPDLALCGRTLLGAMPAKGQQLEDHYFGSIPPRVQDYIAAFEQEVWKLGIPIRTRHNEVAPSQFECAPEFGEVNRAVDHNLLLMDVMQKVAREHNYRVLFHEKPYAGINGSGKHNNWSMGTNTGKNLLSPGKKPKENLQFLAFFINTIKAVHSHAGLLRAAIASAGNDHRLGANEAPPAIISIFIGSQLTELLTAIEHSKDVIEKGDNMYLKLGISKLPEILLDNTDRNRTSPFAFTGNKFEFRAVGSSANSSEAMMVLNTIVANQLTDFAHEVEAEAAKGGKREVAIVNILQRYIAESKSVLFEGNGYSEEWVTEAATRGLENITTTPQALKAYTSDASLALFKRFNILTHREADARLEIAHEQYVKMVQIESRILADLISSHVIPATISYQNTLIENARGLLDLGLRNEAESCKAIISEISGRIARLNQLSEQMVEARKQANAIEQIDARAEAYCTSVRPFMEPLRYEADKLELICADALWPLPKYRELLFTY
jgi:glutamine synthetase